MVFEMTIDFTKPVQTKCGQPVEIISTTARGAFPIVGYIGDFVEIQRWDSKGIKFGYGDGGDLENILEYTQEKKVMYVNVYMDGSSRVCDLKEEAIKLQSEKCIACVRVEYTEGQFDE
tara:strand:- start:5487 stop:5840 length:354 start_codon:yes stop_codon:yes gene_type:complete